MLNQALHRPYRQIWEDSLTIFWRDWLDLRGRVWQVVASGLVAPSSTSSPLGWGWADPYAQKPWPM